jgi:hypothetical protein
MKKEGTNQLFEAKPGPLVQAHGVLGYALWKVSRLLGTGRRVWCDVPFLADGREDTYADVRELLR